MKRTTVVLAAVLGLAACTDRGILNPAAPLGPVRTAADEMAVAGRTLVPGEDFVAGQIIVRFTPGAARSEIAEAHRAHKKSDMLLSRTEILDVPVGEEVAIAAEMSKNPNVEFAEPDYISRLVPCEVAATCLVPDGSLFDRKWDLHNTGNVIGQTGMKADADMDWAEAFDFLGTNYAGAAVIGILDTGIRPTHQQFAGKILTGRRFLEDGVAVTNYIDDNSHGTHVAGIAAGLGAIGTASVPGVAYGANIKLLIGKVCNAAGSCPSSATANGIVWMADNGANVINMSLGSYGGNPDGSGSSAQRASLQYALGKNVLSVCATGNDDGKVGYVGGVGYPARFAECMAIGATNWDDKKASFSNYGPQIAVSAPGGDGNALGTANSLILSASINGDNLYSYKAGTSMATPQVAGLAALLYAQGYTTAAAVRQRIIETVDDVEAPGWDARTGAGRVNVYRAITGQSPNAPPVAAPGTAYAGAKGVPVQFNGGASNDPNGKPITFAWNFGDAASASNTATTASPSHTYMKAGSYTVTLTVTDASGLRSTATTTAVIPNIVPAISALPDATLLPGETYAASGSFTDADPDSWSAAVGYGEGATQPLALAGKAFELSHRYENAGVFGVSVTVSDNDGGTGTRSASVTVLTASQAITSTLLDVLGTGGTSALNGTNDTGLRAPLLAAQASLDRGNPAAALNQLAAFKQHVAGLANGAQVSAGTAADLTARADRVIASLTR